MFKFIPREEDLIVTKNEEGAGYSLNHVRKHPRELLKTLVEASKPSNEVIKVAQ